ncbi:DUF3108 domain-containing protein [Photobacterium angustum]|uniref:DUF3108 domain-containing protein n=2 Tax=Photobacterium angustum TaxID=661 RepID=Q1ZSF4_PHOAS|nr:DUF3108 domain-containing protein [Photobacterium angustum]KJF80635.1 hypothetical protein UB36_16855 [Photobacterium damselae subsp. damselae]EAS65023.1 hypothetical protein VAS14_04868 [Photobacterium angustum S14]KJG00645.1 hypothetical protein UB35_17295 [Photobacterium angustum]KJG27982.1 hypothetical protein UA69_18140 [Photobacterium angustum]KJG37897.1 hypothetical protein UA35_16715 [Photobacterium angustum]
MRLLSLFTSSVLSLLSVTAIAAPTSNTSTALQKESHTTYSFPNQFHQCKKTLNYNIFFKGQKIGHYQRHIVWKGDSADIYTNSEVDVLITKSKMDSHTQLHWSDAAQRFVTDKFQRTISGLMAGNVSVTFSDDGHNSTVTEDGKTQKYTNALAPILDGDTIGSQMRLDLIEGKKNFDFIMQNSDETSHYYFAVVGNETINTNFGTLNTIRVNQTRKSDRQLSLWFAPSLDYQLVKATYHRKIVDLEAVLMSKKMDCPPKQLFKK